MVMEATGSPSVPAAEAVAAVEWFPGPVTAVAAVARRGGSTVASMEDL
jgi:hypothetical protein